MTSNKLNVVVAGRDRETVEFVGAVAGKALHCTPTQQHIVNGHADPLYAHTETPDVLILDLAADWREQLNALIARPPSERPALLVIGPPTHVEAMRLAMRAGACDYLGAPVGPADLLQALSSLQLQTLTPQNEAGHWISVIGARGGVGASTVATNIAVMLQQQARTALVDLDVHSGSLAGYLDVEPRHHLVEALESIDEIDAVALDGFLAQDETGLRLLASAAGEPVPEFLPDDACRSLFQLVRGCYPHIVADLPRQIFGPGRAALELSDTVFLVMQQNVASLREALHLSETLAHEHQVSAANMRVVVNRYSKHSPVTLKKIQQNLGDLKIYTIANDFHAVMNSLDIGVPIMRNAPASAAARSLRKIGDDLVGEPTRRGFISSLSNMLRI